MSNHDPEKDPMLCKDILRNGLNQIALAAGDLDTLARHSCIEGPTAPSAGGKAIIDSALLIQLYAKACKKVNRGEDTDGSALELQQCLREKIRSTMDTIRNPELALAEVVLRFGIDPDTIIGSGMNP